MPRNGGTPSSMPHSRATAIDPLDRAAENADLPSRRDARFRGRAQARDVGREGGDDHPALRLRR